MSPGRLKKPLLTLNRVLGHSSAKNHMSKMQLGDVDALGEETNEKRLRKTYEKREKRQSSRESKVADYEKKKKKKKEDEESSRANEPPEVRSRYGTYYPGVEGGDIDRDDSNSLPKPTCSSLSELGEAYHDQFVSFTARLHHVRSMSAKMAFIVFRQQMDTLQGLLQASDGEISEGFVRWALHVEPETIVHIRGRIRRAPEPVRSCSIHDIECHIESMHVLVPAESGHQGMMNVHEMDQAREDEETHEIHLLASNRARVGNRIVFLRLPVMQAVFRIRSAVCAIFRDVLDERGFIEIQTPKLQPAATESGAEVFRVGYFGRTAFLAQSPQLAKQMAISADFRRVYEIGPVFRAEDSNTHRHLTEYTGLDLEMAIERDYYEALDIIDETLKAIFQGIYKRYRRELDVVKTRFPHNDLIWLDRTPRLTFREGVRLLNESGWKDDDGKLAAEDQDLGTRAEIRLGQAVREKYGTDYFILDKFPTWARPFYTHLDAEDESVTNSFDIFLRGQEITTGGQRIHDARVLAERMRQASIDPDSMDEYMQAFRWGAPPHAGCGIGLERVLFLMLDLGDVRNGSMFPRDPKSMPAVSSNSDVDDVPFPDADTIRYAMAPPRDEEEQGRELPDLGRLIANYGDGTNTSWLDEDRYTVWRHAETGAAVGYASENGYALVMGNPLCDRRQYPAVTSAFLKDLAARGGDRDKDKDKERLRPIWLLVSDEVEDLLASRLGWRTLSAVAEQRLDVHAAKPVLKKERQARNADLRIRDTQLSEPVPEDVRKRCDARIEDWKESRRGKKQVHLTEVRPWTCPEHRRFVWAEDRDGKVQGLVVLHRLSPRNGYQIKFALDFPGSPSGAIETLIVRGLQILASQGVRAVTFGAGATEDVEFGHMLDGTMRARILRHTYQLVLEQLHLAAKSGFREKFGAEQDRVHICYPWLGLGVSGARTLIKFFEDEM